MTIFTHKAFYSERQGGKRKGKKKKINNWFLSFVFKHLVPSDDEQQMVTVTKKIFCHMYVYVKGSF